VTPDQCREARRLLGWTQLGLADVAGIHKQVVGAFERIGRVAQSKSGADHHTAIRAALEAAGVEFTNGNSPGVRLRAGR
jgi:hypothetical protein